MDIKKVIEAHKRAGKAGQELSKAIGQISDEDIDTTDLSIKSIALAKAFQRNLKQVIKKHKKL